MINNLDRSISTMKIITLVYPISSKLLVKDYAYADPDKRRDIL